MLSSISLDIAEGRIQQQLHLRHASYDKYVSNQSSLSLTIALHGFALEIRSQIDSFLKNLQDEGIP